MAHPERRALTPLDFRRDVRLFLAVLVGFLVVLLFAVVLMLQSFEQDAEIAARTSWERATDFAANEITSSPNDDTALETRLTMIRGRYDVVEAALARPSARTITVGGPAGPNVETFTRPTQWGTLSIRYDTTAIKRMRTTFFLTAGITLTASAAGVILLLLYIPTITEPIAAMLASASQIRAKAEDVDEREYLIETFRESIATLKAQETELQRLHELEKTRADDLERVTATLTRSLTSGFLAIDPEGCIVDINSAAREMLSPLHDDVYGLAPEEAFGAHAFSAALAEAVHEQKPITRGEVTIGEGDTARTIGMTTVPLVGEAQQFLGTLALFTDLTRLRELESRLREIQSLAQLGEISAGIAHEFRNSLAAILGYLRLARRAALPAAGDRSVENAEREANILSSAVDALLAFARPMQIELQPVDLREMTAEIVARMAEQNEAIPLSMRGDGAVPADADPVLLGRAIENLVRNAIESVRERGSGEVAVAVSASPPEVRVEDSGVGLDPAEVARLFLPFQSDRSGGHGLGLPLARKIVLLHGGAIQLTGTPREGAVATIRLPERSSVATVTIGNTSDASTAGGASKPTA